MTKDVTKYTIGVGVAGTGFIGPAHVEGLRRNGIMVAALAEETKEKAAQKAAELGIPRGTPRSTNCWPIRRSRWCIWPRPTTCTSRTPRQRCWPAST